MKKTLDDPRNIGERIVRIRLITFRARGYQAAHARMDIPHEGEPRGLDDYSPLQSDWRNLLKEIPDVPGLPWSFEEMRAYQEGYAKGCREKWEGAQ